MIPITLQDKLKERIEVALDSLSLEGRSGESKKIQVFTQHLPTKEKTKERQPEHTYYPCVIIRLQQGEQQSYSEPQSARVLFVVGVYDPDDSNQGYRDALTILQRISQNLQKHPLVNQQFELNYPMTWEYTDEDAEPYYFAWLDTTWGIPKVNQEQWEGLV